MAKGNRTDSRRETKHLQENNSRYKQEIDTYKEYALNRKKNRVHTQEQVTVLYENLCQYIEEQRQQDKPLTVAGAILAAGIDTSIWYRMKNGDYDFLLDEFLDLHDIDLDEAPVDEAGMKYGVVDGVKVLFIEYGEVVKRYMLLLQEQAEQRLYSKGGKVTDIFTLKALHGWQDSPQVINDNRTLNIDLVASPEEAKAALDRLGEARRPIEKK